MEHKPQCLSHLGNITRNKSGYIRTKHLRLNICFYRFSFGEPHTLYFSDALPLVGYGLISDQLKWQSKINHDTYRKFLTIMFNISYYMNIYDKQTCGNIKIQPVMRKLTCSSVNLSIGMENKTWKNTHYFGNIESVILYHLRYVARI